VSGSRPGLWWCGGVAASLGVLAGCGDRPDAAPRGAAVTLAAARVSEGRPPAQDAEPGPAPNLTLGPVSTFSQSCARCHGPRGSFYGDTFGELRGEALREIVEEMMAGPAGLRPTHAEVDAMAAYHRALLADQPFVVVTNAAAASAGQAGALRGEADPGAEVAVTAGEEVLEVKRDGVSWSAALPAGWSGEAGPTLAITATRGDAQTRLAFPAEAWSHNRDAPPEEAGAADPEGSGGPQP